MNRLKPPKPLSKHDMRVIALVTKGMKNPEIANKVGLSESSVKNTLRKIYDTLGFHNRVEIALWYIKYHEHTTK